MASIDPVSAVVQIGTATAQTIASIQDMNKRRNFEQSLALLNSDQKNELEKQLMATNDRTARFGIMSGTMTQFLIANQTAGAKNDVLMYSVAGGLAIVLLVMVVIFVKRK